MHKKHLFLATWSLLLVFPSLCSATLINQTDGDLNWNLDSETGLQWLDLTHTTGLSFNQMKGLYGDWELATESQWRDMYSRNFDGDLSDGAVSGDSSAYGYNEDLGTEQIAKNGTDAFQIYSAYDDFFGQSLYRFEKTGGAFDINRYRESFFSLGLYVNDIDMGFDITARLRVGGMSALIDRNGGSYSTTVENYVDSTANFGRYWQMMRPNANPEHGWYLIKQAPDVTEVTAPSTLSLMLFVLVFLVGLSKRAVWSRE